MRWSVEVCNHPGVGWRRARHARLQRSRSRRLHHWPRFWHSWCERNNAKDDDSLQGLLWDCLTGVAARRARQTTQRGTRQISASDVVGAVSRPGHKRFECNGQWRTAVLRLSTPIHPSRTLGAGKVAFDVSLRVLLVWRRSSAFGIAVEVQQVGPPVVEFAVAITARLVRHVSEPPFEVETVVETPFGGVEPAGQTAEVGVV